MCRANDRSMQPVSKVVGTIHHIIKHSKPTPRSISPSFKYKERRRELAKESKHDGSIGKCVTETTTSSVKPYIPFGKSFQSEEDLDGNLSFEMIPTGGIIILPRFSSDDTLSIGASSNPADNEDTVPKITSDISVSLAEASIDDPSGNEKESNHFDMYGWMPGYTTPSVEVLQAQNTPSTPRCCRQCMDAVFPEYLGLPFL